MRITVGICTSNRDKLLRELLSRLSAIELGPLAPEDVQLVVVDNRPNDDTRRLCAELAAGLPMALVYVPESERGISPARNRAVAEMLEAGSDALAFIDDDDLPEPDWLLRLVDRWRETGADIVIGNWITTRSAERGELEGITTNDTGLWKKNGLPHRLSTCNVLIGRPIIERLGARGPVFDLAFAFMGGGDADFFCRAKLAGASFVRAERSLVHYRQPAERKTVAGTMRRKYKGGISQGFLVRRYMGNGRRLFWFGENLGRLAYGVAALPLGLLSRKQAIRRTGKLAWAVGAFHGFMGGRYNYYVHS